MSNVPIPQSETARPLFTATVFGKPIPQARARTAFKDKNGKALFKPRTYHSSRSEAYRETCFWEFRRAMNVKPPLPLKYPLQGPLWLVVRECGMRTNADLDNLMKQLKDAMVQAGVIAGDSKRFIRKEQIETLDDGAPRVEVELWAL